MRERTSKVLESGTLIYKINNRFFTLSRYTGLAYVDVYSLSKDDVVEEGNILWIRKARHKTNVMCHIPIIKPARDILDKYAPLVHTT